METEKEIWSTPKLERVSVQKLTRNTDGVGNWEKEDGCGEDVNVDLGSC